MVDDRPTITRAELHKTLGAVQESQERVRKLGRSLRWGVTWRRALIVGLLLMYAGEVWRQYQ